MLAILGLFVLPLEAAIVDRIAIAIGHRVITESQIDEELRTTALLNHRALVRDATARRDAADRLIQQFLIQNETELSRYPAPPAADVDAYERQVEADFQGRANLERELKAYDLDPEVFRAHLARLLETMRFIEFRFRPEFSKGDTDVDRKTDEALNVWLEEARKRFNIVYLDKALR